MLCTLAAIAPASGRSAELATRQIDADPPPRIAITPARFPTADADPGDVVQLELTIRNHYPDRAIEFTTLAVPLEGSDDPDSFASAGAPDSPSTEAVDWVSFAVDRWPRLEPNHQLTLPVTVRIPEDARPGAYALALTARLRVAALGVASTENSGARVELGLGPASQLVIRVSGEATSDMRIRDISSPRVVWGGDKPRFRATAENTGDTLLQVDGEVQLDAFWGAAGRDLAAESQSLLPGGRRRMEMRWSDPPLFGYFRPTLVAVGGTGTGVRVERELPGVWVLPPWWLILLAIFAVLLPTWRILRRRRDPQWRAARRARAVDRVTERRRRADAKRRAQQARRGPPPRR